jgi:hypothetical protein
MVRRMFTALKATLVVAATMALAGCSMQWPGATPAAAKPSADPKQAALRFSQCMREHGVPDFPDPTTSGNGNSSLVINGSGSGSDLDPNATAFKDATAACQKYMPSGGAGRGKPDPQMQQKALRYSKCMRDHGLTDFPDPKTNTDGGVSLQIDGSPDLDPTSPKFQAAQQACAPIMGLPKNGGGMTTQGPGPGGGGPGGTGQSGSGISTSGSN